MATERISQLVSDVEKQIADLVHLAETRKREQRPIEPDELEVLRQTLAEQRVRIAQAEEQILSFNARLEELVAERTTQLEATLRDLRRANAAKDQFLALMSHELRTPLTTILGNAEFLERRAGREGASGTAEADIKSSAVKLRQLIENLMILSRLTLGEQIYCEPLVLRHTINDVVRRFQRSGYRRTVEVDVADDVRPVIAGPVSVEQVLENLLSNADKYGGPDHPVVIRASSRGDYAVVSVRDYGIGIDEAEAERIFLPFYRSDRTRFSTGAGIGLAVCRRLIEAQSGRIWASAAEGGGTEVSFSLPFAEEPTVP